MHNYAKVGGILSIVAGAFGLLSIIGLIIAGFAMWFASDPAFYDYSYEAPPEQFLSFIAVIFVVSGILNLALGALAVVGGIFALRKRIWGLALAGAIAGAFTFFPCGVVAIIFTAMAKPEFDALAPTAPRTY